MKKILEFPLVLLALSIIWLFYMGMSLDTLFLVLFLISIGWWIRGHFE